MTLASALSVLLLVRLVEDAHRHAEALDPRRVYDANKQALLNQKQGDAVRMSASRLHAIAHVAHALADDPAQDARPSGQVILELFVNRLAGLLEQPNVES